MLEVLDKVGGLLSLASQALLVLLICTKLDRKKWLVVLLGVMSFATTVSLALQSIMTGRLTVIALACISFIIGGACIYIVGQRETCSQIAPFSSHSP